MFLSGLQNRLHSSKHQDQPLSPSLRVCVCKFHRLGWVGGHVAIGGVTCDLSEPRIRVCMKSYEYHACNAGLLLLDYSI